MAQPLVEISSTIGAVELPQPVTLFSEESAPQPEETEDHWSKLPRRYPDPGHLANNLIHAHKPGPEARIFDMIRTKALIEMRRNGWRRLAITAPSQGCGTTTLVCNLALSMTRQATSYALILDMNLRNPQLAERLGIAPPKPISAWITQEASAAEQAVRLRDNVALALNDEPVHDPSHYAFRAEQGGLLNRFEKHYAPDLIVMDTAPALSCDETYSLLTGVDCALIVARAEHTTIAEIDLCEREIAAHTNVLGIVLNNWDG